MITQEERQLQLESFVQTRYKAITRNGSTYVQTYQWAKQGIERVLLVLREHSKQDQSARLMRDEIDFHLKRCHDYCIKERIGAHYKEVGRRRKDCDFEHVIPKAVVRELLIYDKISIDEALNIPTCLLGSENHTIINKVNVSSTPDIVDFWRRYRETLPDIKIETYNGLQVDLNNWNFWTHYHFFRDYTNL